MLVNDLPNRGISFYFVRKLEVATDGPVGASTRQSPPIYDSEVKTEYELVCIRSTQKFDSILIVMLVDDLLNRGISFYFVSKLEVATGGLFLRQIQNSEGKGNVIILTSDRVFNLTASC